MSSRLARRVLLIGWDAADWKLITPLLEAGLMPSLQSLIERGVMGNLASLQPMLSPILWNSIATGKRGDKHGILGFLEPDDSGLAVRPVTSTSRRCKAIWNILSQTGIDSAVVGWFASHPAEPIAGTVVSNHFALVPKSPDEPWPLPPGTIHPPELAGALADLRLHPGELTSAHLLPFIPRASEIDQRTDRRLVALAKCVAEAVTIHAAATWILEHQPCDFLAVYFELIDHIGHHFMPFHPPRRPHVDEREYEIYKDVVNGAYRFSDMMLGRLLQLAGEDSTVIVLSDHGFHSDHLRPSSRGGFSRASQPVAWHRPLGMIAMAGPHIRADERIYGASLLDITPTVLTLFGLAVGDDMDGRPLLSAFAEPPAVRSIPSWEDVDGASGLHPRDRQADVWETREALRRLADLGYIEEPGEDQQALLKSIDRDRRWNLARIQLESGRLAEAVTLLSSLHAENPDDHGLTLALARCRLSLGEFDACRTLLDGLPDQACSGSAAASLLRGRLAIAEDRIDQALTHLLRAEQAEPRLPTLHVLLGTVYLRLDRLADAQRAFELALEIDGDSPSAHHGLAVVHLRNRQYEEAADAALVSVGLLHHQPMAHLHLGIALAHLRDPLRAIQALETSVQLNPNLAEAHRWLATLYQKAVHDSARSAQHARLADALASRA